MKRLLFSVALIGALLTSVASAAVGDQNAVGAAYSISNAASGNQLVFYDRSSDGSLALAGSVSAGGLGTGGGLASQSAVTVTDNGRTVLTVNPGSNSVAAFAVGPDGPQLLNTVPSGGIRPVSVAVHKQLVYVLNKNNVALATVSGFMLDRDGLTPIAGSTRVLHAGATDAAQVKFSPSGGVLVVTGRSSQRIDTFRVGADGLLSDLKSFDVAPGATPFGFDFDNTGHLLVSLAGVGGSSGAASYSLLTALCRRSPRRWRPASSRPAGSSPPRAAASHSSRTRPALRSPRSRSPQPASSPSSARYESTG
jgi:6-phosphogluconolactonase